MNDKSGEESDKWEIFRYFLGKWQGVGTGKPGISSVERAYTLILAGQFIEVRGISVYKPQEANPQGEIHEELGLVSFDKIRSRYMYREFLVEGYVNRYVLDEHSEGALFSFVTESIENLPTEWRARTTLEILSADSFREIFDLAGPDSDWTCYTSNEFQRVK